MNIAQNVPVFSTGQPLARPGALPTPIAAAAAQQEHQPRGPLPQLGARGNLKAKAAGGAEGGGQEVAAGDGDAEDAARTDHPTGAARRSPVRRISTIHIQSKFITC